MEKNDTNKQSSSGTRNTGASTTSPTVATGRHSDSAVEAALYSLQLAVQAIRGRFPLGAVIQKS